jgi:hypothetical protein
LVGVGRLEQVPDAAGEVAFEASQRFAVGLAFGAFAFEVGLGFAVAACAGERDAVQRGVELAVAAAVQAVAVGAPGADGDRRDAGGARELGVVCEAAGAGDLAEQLGGRQWPEAWLDEQLRRGLGDELGDLGLELGGGGGELAQPSQLVARDPDSGGLLGAREPPPDPRRLRL